MSLPVVVVGEEFYQIDLTLVPNTEPLEFSLSGGTEIFGASGIGASTFVGATLSIPLLRVGQVSYFLELSLISDSPVKFQLSNAGIVIPELAEIQQARELFQSTVSPSIVQSRCVACHVAGGLSGHTRFVLTAGNDKVDANFDVLSEFLTSINGGGDLLLDKARGVSHGGGVQLAGDSTGFQNFDQFLTLLGKQSISETVSVASFFEVVTLLSRQDTLRKATELLQGRLATPSELAVVAQGSEDSLKAALFELMQGEVFKGFIRTNANDILLTMGAQDISSGFEAFRFIDSRAVAYQFYLETGNEQQAQNLHDNIVSDYVRRQPLELINYVVENERPYTEILTADYIMVNPYANTTFKAGAQFTDPNNLEEWQPGSINNYVIPNDNQVTARSVDPLLANVDVVVAGDILNYPHVGILNTPAFLTRYPSTATNRNRARARWTYKFFLGIDIEASAPRTTDPVALADTNNPTLNNPNCTVCHEIHDPVAGAFQDYGHEWGWYRENRGENSLDPVYIHPEDGDISLYAPGDTWYRDMRVPGFNGNTPAKGENSLRWLAEEITNDPRFATATVKFWWKGVFGTEPLLIPEVETDLDFQERLTAFEVENSLINELAEGFRTGFSDHGPYNLKDLLVEMIMGPRFRSGTLEGVSEAVRNAYVGVGPGRILSPELMQTKIESVLGIKWVQNYDPDRDIETLFLPTDYLYHFLYGGIDSFGIVDRPQDYSTVMRSIVELLGIEGSGAILGNDLIKKRADRTLFPFVEMNTDPNTSAGAQSIKQNVQLLVNRLWNKDWGIDHAEVQIAFKLWSELYAQGQNDRIANPEAWWSFISGSASPEIDREFGWKDWDALQSPEKDYLQDFDNFELITAWRGLISYLVTDFEFIYQ